MICIIPSKGFSVRLPRKNFLPINGKTLLQRAIDCAKEARLFNQIIVTSEDREARDIIFAYGACRPRWHQSAKRVHTCTAAVVFDVLGHDYYEHDSFCVLNPSTPTRTAKQLQQLNLCFVAKQIDCLMTGTREHHDGAALFCRTDAFLATLDFHKLDALFVETTQPQVDIDTAADFARAEAILIEREGLVGNSNGLLPGTHSS